MNVSEDFKEAMRQPIKAGLIGSISYTDSDGNPQVITGGDDLLSMTKTEEGSFFSTVMKKLEFKVMGVSRDLRGLSVTAEFAALLLDGETRESCSWGAFEVSEMKIDENTKSTTFTAYNDMYAQFEREYIPGVFTFPTTLAGLIQQLGDEMGFSIDTDPSTLPNANLPVNEDLWATINGTTLRNILGEIAGATATMCSVSTEDKTLSFIPLPLDMSGAELLDDGQIITAKIGTPWGPANSIVLSRMPQNDNIVLTDDASIAEHGLTEVKLANNEIFNDYREQAATVLLPAINGFRYENGEVRTIGHGWHEVGDALQVSIGGISYNIVVTRTIVTIDGGIKETLTSITPDRTNTDYSKAGGVTRTIFNTQLDVDKQANEIRGIVQRIDTFEDETNDNFSQVIQDIHGVTTSVQNSGGANLIRNSAGYFKDSDNNYAHWSATGGPTTLQDALAIQRGSLSKMAWRMAGATIAQQIQVSISTADDDDNVYSFSCRVKKGAVGTGSIVISNLAEEYRIDLASGESRNYDTVHIQAMRPKTGTYTITVVGSSDSDFMVTDMMLARGEFVSQWQQANGEFANTSVNIDIDAMTTSSSTNPGNYTQQRPSGFEGFRNDQNTYGLDDLSVRTDSAILRSSIEMPPIKIVSMTSGWAFVETQ